MESFPLGTSKQPQGNLLIPKLIQTEAENEAALARLDEIFDAKLGTPDGDEAELLIALIEAYERVAYPIDLPDPIAVGCIRYETDDYTIFRQLIGNHKVRGMFGLAEQ